MLETASVSEYFPKVPPKCYECPGLVAAACRLRKEGVDPVKTDPSPADDAVVAAETELAVAGLEQATEVAPKAAVLPHGPLRALGAVASIVYWGCVEGATVSRRLKWPRFRWPLRQCSLVVVVTSECGSASPASYMVPQVVTEQQVFPRQS